MNKINFKEKKLGKGGLALSEIFILVISILAFAYFVGNQFEVVSAAAGETAAADAWIPEVIELPASPLPTSILSEPIVSELYIWSGGAPVTSGTPSFLPGGFVGGNVYAGPGGAALPESLSAFGTRLWTLRVDMLWNAAIAGALYLGIRAIFDWIGLCPSCDPELVKAWASAMAIGYGAGAVTGILLAALSNMPSWGLPIFGIVGFGWGLIGLGVAFIIMAIFYRQDYIVAVQYTCYPWKPNTGGNDCDLCNGRDFPCTKYKCQSLGQGCELLNPGKKTQVCSWKDRNDAAPPTISAWNEKLTSGYQYIPLTTQTGDKGVEIKNTNSNDGCVPPFTRIDYGIQLDKPGQCKIDFVRKSSFNEMTIPGVISGGDWLKEHSLFSLHGGIDAANASGIELPNGGEYQIFVRCISRNGVANTGTFVLKYCVSNEPDTTAPTIKLVDLPNGAPIQFGQTSRKADVYVNKPSDCKWDHNDVGYDLMAGTMSCSQNIGANTYYKCTTNLTGLKDEMENKFYFRCKSYPANAEANRYKNEESYQYRLIGTRPLVIDSVTPVSGAVIKDSTQSVKVTLKAVTSAGYNNGAAKCWYKKQTDANNRYNQFANTDSYQSSQELWFSRGSYRYTVKCCDLGGNCATKETDFTIDTDFSSSIVVRAYNEGSSLKIITNEKSECVYDTTSCTYNFDDGIKMVSSDNTAHTTEWNTNSNFYIKCKDEFGNQPAPDGCSITIRPIDFD